MQVPRVYNGKGSCFEEHEYSQYILWKVAQYKLIFLGYK